MVEYTTNRNAHAKLGEPGGPILVNLLRDDTDVLHAVERTVKQAFLRERVKTYYNVGKFVVLSNNNRTVDSITVNFIPELYTYSDQDVGLKGFRQVAIHVDGFVRSGEDAQHNQSLARYRAARYVGFNNLYGHLFSPVIVSDKTEAQIDQYFRDMSIRFNGRFVAATDICDFSIKTELISTDTFDNQIQKLREIIQELKKVEKTENFQQILELRIPELRRDPFLREAIRIDEMIKTKIAADQPATL